MVGKMGAKFVVWMLSPRAQMCYYSSCREDCEAWVKEHSSPNKLFEIKEYKNDLL